MVDQMCQRLKEAGSMTGKRLALETFHDYSADNRQLRLLVAYARVHRHIPEIIGIPGSGYSWANPTTPAGRAALRKAAGYARHMGRCFLFIAANHQSGGVAMTAAQMLLDWFNASEQPTQHHDDLANLIAAEGADAEALINALFDQLTKTEAGKAAMAKAGQRYAQHLISAELHAQLKAQALLVSEQAQTLADLLKQAPGIPAPQTPVTQPVPTP